MRKALIIQLLFWGWIARNTISVDLPGELEVESAGRYYAAAERRYYELVFAPSSAVAVTRTNPLPQVEVRPDGEPIRRCPR